MTELATRHDAVPQGAVPRGAAIAGAGYAVPDTVVSNAPIARRLDVDEAWIERRTGTRERRVLATGERLDGLAAHAALAALSDAGVEPASVDMVLVATTSSDEMSPHAAPLVAGMIGAGGAAAIDLGAACTGFLSGLAVGASAIESGRARDVLVIGADALSRYVDEHDRQSAMLFGDGAGAVVLTAADGPSRIGPVAMHSDPAGSHLIRLARDEKRIRMEGPAVYRQAVALLAEVTREAVAAAGLTLEDVDLFVYHQANSRILRAVGDQLGIARERVVDIVGRFANTSAGTLPIALATAAQERRLRPGAQVLLAAFGSGLVWGGAVVEWGRGNVGAALRAGGGGLG